MPTCDEYNKFIEMVPIDKLSVVYASENLVNPSSMMGHAMLAVEGTRGDGYFARHSASFFTELDSLNPAKIIWDTIIKGKEGYFLVKPLNKHYEFYNEKEQRNVWNFKLAASTDDRNLIRDHLWELKNPDIKYFFHKHNCATIVIDILKIARPNLDSNSWTSPQDVIKAIDNEKDFISSTSIMPSHKWRIRMLEDVMGSKNAVEVFNWAKDPSNKIFSDDETGFAKFQLANSLLQYSEKYPTPYLTAPETAQKALSEVTFSNNYNIDLSNYKSPTNTPDDSSVSIGYLKREEKDFYRINWLPASRTLQDDNRLFFSENELILSQIVLNIDEDSKVDIDRLMLYSIDTFTPVDRFTGGLSGYLHLGHLPQYDEVENIESTFELAGGLGKTYALGSDLRVYARLGTGISGHSSRLFIEPEFGAYLYEIFGMKSWIRYRPRIKDSEDVLHQYNFTHSISFDNFALILDSVYVSKNDLSSKSFELSFRKYY